MIEKAIVSKKRGKTVYVTLERKPACDTCNTCVFGKAKSLTLPALSQIDCEIGDVVSLEMPKKNIPFASVFLYALPLLFMLIGTFIGARFSEFISIILSFIFLVIAVFFVFLTDKYAFRKNPNYNPIIKEIVDKNEITNKTNQQE